MKQARLAYFSVRMRERIRDKTDEERQARLADVSVRMRERIRDETDE